MDLLIKNGTIVTAKESYKADVAVNDGKIVAIGSNLDFDADKVVDAGGKLVLPGAIDVHTHLAMPFGGTVSADSYLAGTRAAACGGVTTVFDYPVQHSGETIMGLINSKKEVLEKEACVDYAFHCCITDLNGGEILDEMETAVKEGLIVTSNYFVAENGVTRRSRRFSVFIGCLRDDRLGNNGNIYIVHEVEENLHFLLALAAGFVRGIDDDFLDILVHDGLCQLLHIHIFLCQGDKGIQTVVHFFPLFHPFFDNFTFEL